MFRLVKIPETGESLYFLLCDHRQCMDARRGPANVTSGEEYRLTKRQFFEAAMKEGWWIDFEGMYCPPHAREMLHAVREHEERAKTAVVAATPGQMLAFGKSR